MCTSAIQVGQVGQHLGAQAVVLGTQMDSLKAVREAVRLFPNQNTDASDLILYSYGRLLWMIEVRLAEAHLHMIEMYKRV